MPANILPARETRSTARSASGPKSVVDPHASPLNIDPNLLKPTTPEQEEDEEDYEENDDDEEDEDLERQEGNVKEDVVLSFFSRAKRPKLKVCPFSDSSRENPCSTHNTPRSRKDLIKTHLENIKNQGGDEQHPIDDLLWQSFDVVWFLTPRPTFTKTKKHKAQSISQSLYYKKRKAIQESHEQEMKAKFEEGVIGENEYKKYLIGDKRRRFITERETERRVEARTKGEMDAMKQDMERRLNGERELRIDIENRLQELRGQTCTSNADATSNSAAISALESARKELDATQLTVQAYREVLSSQATNVVNLWADEGFLSSDLTYLQHSGFTWPTISSEASFYIFATLLTPKKNWNGQVRSESSIRHMHQDLRHYVEAEKSYVDPEDVEEVAALDRIVQTFSASCDEIKQNAERTSSMTMDGAQSWIDEQDRMWDNAKSTFQSLFSLDSQPPIQHIRLINEFADTWRAQKAAQEMNATAHAAASDLI